MSWLAVTEDDLLTVMNSPELEAIRAAALAVGQDDPVAPTIAQAVDMVRGYVAGYRANILGAAGTIPQKLLPTTIDIVAYRLPSRVGLEPSESRRSLYNDALALLARVSVGTFAIEEPTTEDTETQAAPSPRMTGKTLTYTRDNQDGL